MWSLYSPLQHLNKRTPEQRASLAEKQSHAGKKYEGATILAAEADKRGCLFVVELSERCEGWNLPWLNDLREKVILHFGVCKGCQVGLCDHKGKLLSKGWRLCGIPHSSYDLAVFE